MPTVRLTDPKKDLSKLKRILTRLESRTNSISIIQKQVANLQTQVDANETVSQKVLEDNLLFTWTGGTLKLSWPAGYLKDKFGKVHQVDAGTSVALVANTYYWATWNDSHRQMAFVTGLDTILQMTPNANLHNFVIAQIFTGTAGQTGTAGGGGSDSTSGLSSEKYKRF